MVTLWIDFAFLRRYDLARKRLGEVEGNLFGTSFFAVPCSLNRFKRRGFMKRIAIAVCVVVLAFAVTIIAQKPEQPKTGSAEQKIMKLEKGWIDAWLKHDAAFMDGILADDYTSTDENGTVLTRTEYLEQAKTGEYVLLSTVANDWKVRVYGDAAVWMGLNTDKAQYKGKDISGQYRWMDVWVKIAGRWQCAASQGTKVIQK